MNGDLDRHQPADEWRHGSEGEASHRQQYHATKVHSCPVVEDAETDPHEQHHGSQRQDSAEHAPSPHYS